MAKGKGKGRGDDDGSSCGGCCCCICCCILLPFILFIVGVFILLAKNTRVERIEEYNRRASEWVNGGMDFYKNATFTINKVIAGNDTETPGQYYPVRDSCKKKDDPTEGCMTTEGFFYKGYKEISPVSSSVTISIESSGNSIINKSYDTIKTYYYYPSDLGCSKDTSKCSSKCSSKGGEWSSSRKVCTVTKYLVGFCYRVNYVNNKWQLDVPAKWPLSGSGAGCYYRNDYAEALYGKNPTDRLPIHIRYYKDSFISADELTEGCSSTTSSSSSSCFGMSKSEQTKTGAIVTVVGLILIGLEIGAVVLTCLCCRDTIKGTFGKKDTLLKKENVPTAQPAYAQPAYAQPAYAQPGYQSGYQSGYQPQPGYQPGYQPAYAQPVYGQPQN